MPNPIDNTTQLGITYLDNHLVKLGLGNILIDHLLSGNILYRWYLSRCYVDQQIGPTLSSCNRRRSSELRQSWTTEVELGWNNSRTRVGV